jgi:hypothetical protein
MVDGKAKGDLFENKICRFLSAWLVSRKYADKKAYKVYDLPFRRRFTDTTPLDGHWSGAGDILHKPDIEFALCVECKDRKNWELDGLLANRKWPPWSWWEQCKRQAERVHLKPLMFFTRPFRQVYVMLDEETAQCLQLKPEHGPVVYVQSPTGERLVVTLAENLYAVPRTTVARLGNGRSSPAKGSKHSSRRRPKSRRRQRKVSGVSC